MAKILDLMITVDSDLSQISVEIYDSENEFRESIVKPFSPDEHPEFDQEIGDLIYSWAVSMADEIEETRKEN